MDGGEAEPIEAGRGQVGRRASWPARVPLLCTLGTSSTSANAAKRVVKLGDYFPTPKRLTVAANTKITWRWPSAPGDQHDVKLTRAPKGVKKFQSPLAGSDYSYSRRLKKVGRYTVICSLHPDSMRQSIRVQD